MVVFLENPGWQERKIVTLPSNGVLVRVRGCAPSSPP